MYDITRKNSMSSFALTNFDQKEYTDMPNLIS